MSVDLQKVPLIHELEDFPSDGNDPISYQDRRPSRNGVGVAHYIRITTRRISDRFNGLLYASRGQPAARASLWHILQSIFLFLLPSFVASRFLAKDKCQKAPHPTAYLDGLRGVASFAVYVHHCVAAFWQPWPGYGYYTDSEGPSYNSLLRLPILNLFYAGPAAVCIFFVVSGYALSVRPISQMRRGETAPLMKTLRSALLRRPFRLFLPIAASTFLMLVLGHLGAYKTTLWYWQNFPIQFNYGGGHFTALPTFWPDLLRWSKQAFNISLTYNFGFWWEQPWGTVKSFDEHLWTIPIEFANSMILFATLVSVSGLKSGARLTIMMALIVLCVLRDWANLLLFWSGMVLCELNMLLTERAKNAVSLDEPKRPRSASLARHKRYLRYAFHTINIFCGCWLLSMPFESAYKAVGYRTIVSFTPRTVGLGWRFWTSVGAIQLMLSISNTPGIARVFASPLASYLGSISYALYLVHGMTLHLIGIPCLWWIFRFTGYEHETPKVLGMFLAFIVTSALTIWASDVFWRAIDVPIVKLGKHIEEKLTMREAYM